MSQPDFTNFYETFYSTFLTTANGLPINSLWVVSIDNVPLDEIEKSVVGVEGWGGLSNTSTTAAGVADLKNPNGLIVATGIKVIGDSIDVTREGKQNTGYIQGLVGNGRAGFPLLNVSFVENNISFVDYVLRPWQVAVSHKSLKHKPLKTTFNVWFLAKTGPNSNVAIRKQVTYHNCCPVNIDEQEYNYTGSDMYKLRSVQFAYSHYTMVEASGSLIGLVGNGNGFFDILGSALGGPLKNELQRQLGKNSPSSLIDNAKQFGKDLLNNTKTRIVTNMAGGAAGLVNNAIQSFQTAALGLGNRAVKGASGIISGTVDNLTDQVANQNNDTPLNSTDSTIGVALGHAEQTTGTITAMEGYKEKTINQDDTPKFVKNIEQQIIGKPSEVDVNIPIKDDDVRPATDAVIPRPASSKSPTDVNADTVMLNTKLKYNLTKPDAPMYDVRSGEINHNDVEKKIPNNDVRTGIQTTPDDRITPKSDYIKTHIQAGYVEKTIKQDDHIKKGAAIPYIIKTVNENDVPVRSN